MALDFNVQQTFEIAERIERNGYKFYLNASNIVKDKNLKEFLVKLSKIEAGHEKKFNKLKNKFLNEHKDEDIIDNNSSTLFFLDKIAKGIIFDIDEIETIFDENTDIKDIFKVAIEKEKDSVIFYEAIRSSSLNIYWKEEIQNIINEELGHIVELKEYLNKFI